MHACLRHYVLKRQTEWYCIGRQYPAKLGGSSSFRNLCLATVEGFTIRHIVVYNLQWTEPFESFLELPLKAKMIKWLAI